MPSAVVFVIAALLPCLSAAASGPTISDEKLNISLTLPDGFEPMDESGFNSLPGMDIRYGFQHVRTDGEPPTCVFIQVLRGTIGREPIPPAVLKKIGGELRRLKWKSFEVDAFVVKEHSGGNTFLTWNVQVPIAPRAIQLKVFGPESRSAELEGVSRILLNSLDGRTNWLSDGERAHNLGEGVGRMTFWLIVIWAVVYGLTRNRAGVFRRTAIARGIPAEQADQKIKPGWWWYLLACYLFFASLVAMGAVVFMASGKKAVFYSLGIACAGLGMAVTIITVVMHRRMRARRTILETAAPVLAPGRAAR